MKGIMIVLSYGARYEIPVFSKEQALSYCNYFNGDNGFCHLYVYKHYIKEFEGLYEDVFDNDNFIIKLREKWKDFIDKTHSRSKVEEIDLKQLYA